MCRRRSIVFRPSRRYPSLRWAESAERTLDDVPHVGGKLVAIGDAAPRGLGEPPALRLKRPPALERGEKARRDLRVFLVEVQDDAADEVIAAAVFGVELRLIACREGADDGAHPVWIGGAK